MDKDFEFDAAIEAMLEERRRTMATFTSDHRPLNLYAIHRSDLEMPPGKLSAQCGHAYQLSLEQAESAKPGITVQYKGSGNGTKLCMRAKNLGQLLRAYREAKAAGLPCALIIDRGHVLPPHFDGQPIITALGIGPCFQDEACDITKRLSLSH